ncbi:MAG TPA: Spy/CpxP family protein refolding chaperone [Kofleriaceae bacterium]|jgi:Spy/CpxP family protein refolding chaperone|nr:Spy/CpxP family protein refolding chaperone [Kofleriaceae bacterium]
MSAALGCGGSSTPGPTGPGGSADVAEAQPAQPGTGMEEDESTTDLAMHHRHHHHGGMAMFIAISLDQINTTPDQKAAIEKIKTDLYAKMEPAHAAEKTVLSAVADDIASGQFDQAKLDTSIAEVGTQSGTIHDAISDSLNQLHATLTPPQRQALVDKMQAHFEVWHSANAPEEDKEHGHLAHLAKELGMTQDQVDKSRAAYEQSITGVPHFDRAEADAHLKAFGEAFSSDQFDAKSLPTKGELNSHMAVWGINRMIKLYEAVTPNLTPEQRTKLADNIRHHANYQHNQG